MDVNFVFFTERLFIKVWTIDKEFVCIDCAAEEETKRYTKEKNNGDVFF